MRKGWRTYVRVGAWASGGGVVVGLDFEGWEEGGEAVFGYGATRMGRGHCEGEEKKFGGGMPRFWITSRFLLKRV